MKINKETKNELLEEAEKCDVEDVKNKVKKELIKTMDSKEEINIFRFRILLQLLMCIKSNLPVEVWISKYGVGFSKAFDNSDNIEELKKKI